MFLHHLFSSASASLPPYVNLIHYLHHLEASLVAVYLLFLVPKNELGDVLQIGCVKDEGVGKRRRLVVGWS